MTMIISGSGTITGLVPGGLPDASVIQADLASTVVGNGPAFSAYQSVAQSVPSASATKITFTTSEFDTTGGMYTSSRFTPTVAGYYQISACVNFNVASSQILAAVYKNGIEFKRGTQFGTATSVGQAASVSTLIYFNGSTDYAEIYGYQASGLANNTVALQATTWFQASMVRSA